MKGTLYDHLNQTDEQAAQRMESLMPELMKQNGVTEQLKAENPMQWTGLMNNLKATAEEMLLKELIYR